MIITMPAVFGVVALALVALAGCNSFGAGSGRPPETVAAQFREAWKACGAPLTTDGGFDQTVVGHAGWEPKLREVRLNQAVRNLPLNAPPVLRDNEYELTEWSREGQAATLNITRWGVSRGRDLADECDMSAQLDKAASANELAEKISQMLARPIDRKGVTARGGDFLTPRSDNNPRAWYWQMPQHDVYLLVFEGTGARLEILAMPNRTALYEYPLENPTARIFVEGQKF